MLRRHLTPALLAFSLMVLILSSRPVLEPRPVLVLFLCAAASSAGIVLHHADHPGARRAGSLLLAAGLGCILGSWSIQRMSQDARRASLPVAQARVSGFSGNLTQDSSLSAAGDTVLRLSLREASSADTRVRGQAHGTVLIFLRGSYGFSLGELLAVRARLEPFTGEGGANFTAWIDRGEIERTGYASGIWAARAQARGWLHRAVSRAGYPVSALMEALLIGSRDDVPQSLQDGFQRTGSLHILALSGLHVSVIYGILLAALGFLKQRGLRVLLATLALLFYQVLAGFMPSLLRATVMICLAGACLMLDRDREPLNLLALSGIAILVVDPRQAGSLSFQLSYLALAGIFLFGPLVQRSLAGRLPTLILAPLAMSLGAQMATFPLIVARFGTYYPSGLLAGLILVPLTTALLWAGLAWLLLVLVPWPQLHELGARALGLLYNAIDESARAFGRLPGISLDQRALLPVVCGSAVLLLCIAVVFPRTRRPALRAVS